MVDILDQLRNHVRSLEESNADLKEKVSGKETEIHSLEETLATERRNNDIAQQELRTKIDSLESEVRNTKQKLIDSKEAGSELETKIIELESNLKISKDSNEDLKKQLAESDCELEGLHSDLKTSNQQIERFREELRAASQQISESEEQHNAEKIHLAREIHSRDVKIEGLENTIEKKSVEIVELEDFLDQLREELDVYREKTETDKAELNTKISELEKSLQEREKILADEKEKYEAKINQQEDILAQKTKHVLDALEQVKNAQKSEADHLHHIKKLEKELRGKIFEVEAVNEDVLKLQDERNQLKSDIEELKSGSLESLYQMKQQAILLDERNSKIEELQEMISSKDHELISLKEQLDARDQENVKLEEDISGQSRDIEVLSSEVTQLENERNKLQKELELTRTQLKNNESTLESELARMEKAYNDLRDLSKKEVTTHHSKEVSLNDDLQKAMKENEALKSKLAELSRSADNAGGLRGELEEKNEFIDSLMGEIEAFKSGKETEIEQLKAKIQELNSAAVGHEHDDNSSGRSGNHLDSSEDLVEKLRESTDQIRDLESQLDSVEIQRHNIERELDRARERIAQLEEDMQCDDSAALIQELRQKERENDECLEHLSVEIEEFSLKKEDEIRSLQEAIMQLEEERSNLSEAKLDLEEELQAVIMSNKKLRSGLVELAEMYNLPKPPDVIEVSYFADLYSTICSELDRTSVMSRDGSSAEPESRNQSQALSKLKQILYKPKPKEVLQKEVKAAISESEYYLKSYKQGDKKAPPKPNYEMDSKNQRPLSIYADMGPMVRRPPKPEPEVIPPEVLVAEEAERHVAELELIIRDQNFEIEQMQKRLALAEADMEKAVSLEIMMTKLKSESDRVQASNEILKRNNSSLNEDCRRLRNSNEQLVREKERDKVEHEFLVKKYEKDMQRLRSRLETAQMAASLHESKLKEAENSLENRSREAEKLRRKNDRARVKLSAAESDLEQLSKEKSQLKAKLKSVLASAAAEKEKLTRIARESRSISSPNDRRQVNDELEDDEIIQQVLKKSLNSMGLRSSNSGTAFSSSSSSPDYVSKFSLLL